MSNENKKPKITSEKEKEKTPKKEIKKEETPKKENKKEEKGKLPDEIKLYEELSEKKYIYKTEFRGKTYIGIREFYNKDGTLAFGKSGINLTVDEFKKLAEHIDDIKEWLNEEE